MRLAVRAIYITLFILNLLFLIWIMFFYHSEGFSRTSASQEFHHNFMPLKSIRQMFRFAQKHHFQKGTLQYLMVNILGNIFLWMPLGYLVYKLKLTASGVKLLFIVILLCTFTEFLQLITMRGNFDIDDIILNTLGVMTGYYLAVYFRKAIQST